jgi:hypothetical protein
VWHNLGESSRSCERARTTERSRLARLGSQPPNQPRCKIRLPPPSTLPHHPTLSTVYRVGWGEGGEVEKKKKRNKKSEATNSRMRRPTCRLGGTQENIYIHLVYIKATRKSPPPKRLIQIARATSGGGERNGSDPLPHPPPARGGWGGCQFPQDVSRTI